MKLSNMRIVQVLSVIAGLTLLTGCTKNLRYPKRQLTSLKKTPATYHNTTHDVTLSAHVFSTDDNINHFNRAVTKMHTIQLSLDNQSTQTWVLSHENIDLPLLTTTQATHHLQDSLGKSVAIFMFLSIVGIIHGVFSHDANKMIAHDIQDKTFEDELVVQPQARCNTLLFAPESCELQPFLITLYNANNREQKITYRIVL